MISKLPKLEQGKHRLLYYLTEPPGAILSQRAYSCTTAYSDYIAVFYLTPVTLTVVSDSISSLTTAATDIRPRVPTVTPVIASSTGNSPKARGKGGRDYDMNIYI